MSTMFVFFLLGVLFGRTSAGYQDSNWECMDEITGEDFCPAPTYSCTCASTSPSTCGSDGSIIGDSGSIHRGLSYSEVDETFRPCLTGYQETEWECLDENTNVDFCSEPSFSCTCGLPECGNGGFGGSEGDVITEVSLIYIADGFNPCLVGRQDTGWTCVEEHSNVNACPRDPTYTCYCLSYCGNGRAGGHPGSSFEGLTGAQVADMFDPCLTGSQDTDWECHNEGTNADFCPPAYCEVCEGYVSAGSCYCDTECFTRGDCCWDACYSCSNYSDNCNVNLLESTNSTANARPRARPDGIPVELISDHPRFMDESPRIRN